jgi:parallel beta-helix repeat protein
MGRRLVSVMSLILAFIGVLGLAVNVQKVETSGPIYIRADGSVDPETAPIQRDGNLYTFTDDIFDGIVVEKDNIVIDGADYMVKGEEIGTGVDLSDRSNVTIKDTEIKAFIYGIDLSWSSLCRISGNRVADNLYGGVWLDGASSNVVSGNSITANNQYGIYLWYSPNNIISENNVAKNVADGIIVGVSSNDTISRNYIAENGAGIYLFGVDNSTISGNNISTNDEHGIWLEWSSSNSVSGNIVTNNRYGILLYCKWGHGSPNNNIFENDITANECGIQLYNSSDNFLCHNDFIDNADQVYSENSVNVWDDGYPCGGNYWSDYSDVDLQSGLGQDEVGSDGIGDLPYEINGGNEDRYPLMGPFNTFDAGTWAETAYSVDVVSSSQVSDFHFNPEEGPFIRFDVTGQDETTGFCRATIPKDLLWVEDGWTILVGGEVVTDYKIILDQNHTYLYFNCQHSTKTVEIQGTHGIPEFPSIIILPLIMIATLIAVVLTKNIKQKPEDFRIE